MLAGVLSGFGLGGGVILMPMFRMIGCNPLQATSTCSFSIFVTTFINCMQGIFIGVIQPHEFFIYVPFFGVASFFVSKAIAGYLRKNNRLSLA